MFMAGGVIDLYVMLNYYHYWFEGGKHINELIFSFLLSITMLLPGLSIIIGNLAIM